MDGSFAFPVSDGTGENREGRRDALQLLEAAGYRLNGGQLVNIATGEPVAIEILAATRAQERLLLTYARALKQVGIEAKIRQVDSAQYQRRKQTYDFDMIQYYWPVSLSPGNEQSFRWGSDAAVTEGSFNYPGVKSPAVDAMIEAMLKARRPRQLRLGDPRARPGAAVGRLCHSAVLSAPPVGRALARSEAAREDAALRLSDRHLVDRARRRGGRRQSGTGARSTMTLQAETFASKDRARRLRQTACCAAARARGLPCRRCAIRRIVEALGFGVPKTLSYREADAAVDALASFFIALGLEPGDTIAAQLPNLAVAPLTLLAAWRAGLTVAAAADAVARPTRSPRSARWSRRRR